MSCMGAGVHADTAAAHAGYIAGAEGGRQPVGRVRPGRHLHPLAYRRAVCYCLCGAHGLRLMG